MNSKLKTENSELTTARIGRGSSPRCFQARSEGSTRTALGEANAHATAPNASQRLHTNGHLKAIYSLGRKNGLDNDALHEFVIGRLAANSAARRTGSFKDLTFAEGEHAIAALKGNDFVPRRTLQYRRAKSNIKTIVSKEALDLIAALATQRHWSSMTLGHFCIRQCGHYPPRTTEQANKVIEALKAMNRREGLWAA